MDRRAAVEGVEGLSTCLIYRPQSGESHVTIQIDRLDCEDCSYVWRFGPCSITAAAEVMADAAWSWATTGTIGLAAWAASKRFPQVL